MNEPPKQILGVIGGLGPAATARFLELTAQMTDAKTDQEHLDVLIYSFPEIPDRTAYILDPTLESPLPAMLRIAQALTCQGATQIAIPCFTAHYFIDALQAAVPVPFIHGILETVRHLQENGITRAGILATDGTIRTGLFSNALKEAGIEAVLPSPERQQGIMHLIYQNIKAGLPPEMERFTAAWEELRGAGAQAVILGCTELSLLKRDHPLGPGCLDAMEVLARESVLRCGKPLKPEYHCLIT